MLILDNLTKTYQSGNRPLDVLKNITLEIKAGTVNAIVGPSGSGKTTLLGLAAGLDRPTTGEVSIDGIALSKLSENELARVRNKHTGFVFQTFQLIPTLTALENVMVPLELRNERNIKPLAEELLEQVGLADRIHHYPTQLSGGEQQRVALARAFINRPQILFADEPTGNLDSDTGTIITDLIFKLNRDFNTTLVLVTHDLELANKTERVIRIKSGEIYSDEPVTPTHA